MATEPEPENKNPFIGPRPFEQKDKGCFFGRLREVNDLVSLIIAHRVVLLYAQSGAGKTSLLNAALTPRLEEEGFEVLPTARVRTAIPEGPLPESISNIFIFAALTGWSQGSANAQRLAGTNLAGFLKDKPHQMDKGNLPLPRLLAFDQFEELFTFYPDRWKDREGFFRQVDDALEADPLLRVVLVIREDFLANLDPYVGLLPERLRAHGIALSVFVVRQHAMLFSVRSQEPGGALRRASPQSSSKSLQRSGRKKCLVPWSRRWVSMWSQCNFR